MRQVFSRLVVASGLWTLACATATEDGPLGGDLGEEIGGSSSSAGSLATAGSTSSAGSLPSAGTTSTAGSTSTSGGKGGSGPTAFGGSATSGGKGGSGSGGASAGSSAGGKAGSASGGSATAGTGNGGTGTAGTASGGSGTAGSASTTCNGVTNWSSKTYATGDTVASVCSGVFAGSCPTGQSHKFECSPAAGVPALPWCQSREPGVGNGWSEAWVDKGQCQ